MPVTHLILLKMLTLQAITKKIKEFLTVDIIEQLAQSRKTRYSQQEHYDCASAFQKSLRGSDANAAIYYLAK